MEQDSANKDDKDFIIDKEIPEVKDRTASVVASNPLKKGAGIVGLILFCLLAIYYIFSANKAEKTSIVVPQEVKVISKDRQKLPKDQRLKEDSDIILLPPKLPELTKTAEIPAPPMPEIKIIPPVSLPPVPKLPGPPSASGEITPPSRSLISNNRNSPMFAISGGGVSSSSVTDKTSSLLTDPSQLLNPKRLEELRNSMQAQQAAPTENSALARTSGQKLATYVGNLSYIIAEGKMVDAVLETSINTALTGEIRAVVSRDIYSEAGDRILIPKGSRLLGAYEKVTSLSQSRVDIGWTRIILPWGIDVALSGDSFRGVDQLGRAGVGGVVDNKLRNIITSSAMLSSIKVAAGTILNKFDDSAITNRTTPSGSTTTTGKAGSLLIREAATDSSAALTAYVNRFADIMPVIKVAQGARLKVFVAKDIVFPKAAFKDYNIID